MFGGRDSRKIEHMELQQRAAPHGSQQQQAPGQPRKAEGLYKALQYSQQSFTDMAEPSPRFGFVEFAETWNGRMAMLGFVIGLGTELLTGQGILSQIGLG